MYCTVVISGFSLGGGKDVYQGDVVDLPSKQSAEKIATGFVRESTPEEVANFLTGRARSTRETADKAAEDAEDEADENGADRHPETAPGTTVDRDPAPGKGGKK